MKTTTAAAATMTFKSERAAKMAYTKAETVYSNAQNAVARVYDSFRNCGVEAGTYAPGGAMFEARKVEAAALEALRAIYAAATAQGFSIRSYHFSTNATRDLIRANRD